MDQKLKTTASFGANLRQIRLQHGYTQEQLVAKMQLLNQSVSRSIYAQMECGNYNIRITELIALKKIYNISYDTFFEGLDIE